MVGLYVEANVGAYDGKNVTGALDLVGRVVLTGTEVVGFKLMEGVLLGIPVGT